MAERNCTPRPFGLAAEDLEIEFTRADRPALVTALLAACGAPREPDHWWAQPVGARHRALLALLRASVAAETVALGAICPACGERAELALPLAALLAEPTAGNAVEVNAQGRLLRLRRPTGADLRAWRSEPPRSRTEALRALLLQGEVQPGDEDRATDALAQADPLVAFAVHCTCPSCGQDADHDVDLEALALQRLAASQRTLLHQVHRLASRYGWTEAQVLALPPTRRARYLALIEADA